MFVCYAKVVGGGTSLQVFTPLLPEALAILLQDATAWSMEDEKISLAESALLNDIYLFFAPTFAQCSNCFFFALKVKHCWRRSSKYCSRKVRCYHL